MTLDDIIDQVIRREGGFVHDPADRGGATTYGITQRTLEQFRKRPVTVEDVMNLTESEARQIYREEYIVRPGFMQIQSDAVRALVVDCAVNHGVKRAVLLLQEAAHVFMDGILGPQTLQAANRMTPVALYRRMCAARVRLYGHIISRDHSQAKFAAGWLNRAAEFIEGTV